MPSLIAGAAAPLLGALLTEYLGPDVTLAVLAGAALINVALVLWLRTAIRHTEASRRTKVVTASPFVGSGQLNY